VPSRVLTGLNVLLNTNLFSSKRKQRRYARGASIRSPSPRRVGSPPAPSHVVQLEGRIKAACGPSVEARVETRGGVRGQVTR
jgi:hypothetical protein